MAENMQFTIGADAICADGQCGEVRRFVIDPVGRAVSHLVVEPKHRQGLGRLVPLDLVDQAKGAVHLHCTSTELHNLKHAEETEFLPASGGKAAYVAGVPLPQPFSGLSGVIGDVPESVTHDMVPLNEIELAGDQVVHATDGAIGRVRGLMTDSDHRVTHVVLHEGHSWGHKEVAVPISAVASVDHGIRLNISKHDVNRLSSTDMDRTDP
jgi:hypothetical protein